MGNPLDLYTIRAAVENDIPQILDIYNERILNSTCLFMYDPVALDNRIAWYMDTKAKGYPIIVAAEKKTNKAIAYACYGGFRPHTAFILYGIYKKLYIVFYANFRTTTVEQLKFHCIFIKIINVEVWEL